MVGGRRKPWPLVCVVATVLLGLMVVGLGVASSSSSSSRAPHTNEFPDGSSAGSTADETNSRRSGSSSQPLLEPLQALPGRCVAAGGGRDAGDAGGREMPSSGDEDAWMFAPVERASLGSRARRFCSLSFFNERVVPFAGSDALKDVFAVLEDTRGAVEAASSGRRRIVTGVSVLFESRTPDDKDWLEPFLLVDRILPALGLARAGKLAPPSTFVFDLPPADLAALLRRHGGLIEGLIGLVASEHGPPSILNLADPIHKDEVLHFEEVLFFARQVVDNTQGKHFFACAGFPSFEAGAALRRAAYAQCGVQAEVASSPRMHADGAQGGATSRSPPHTGLLVRHRVPAFRQFGPNVLDVLRASVKGSVEVYVELPEEHNSGFCNVVKRFARADVIVSAYGSQLVPALFAHDGAHIVELFPKKFRSPAFQMLGSEYGRDIRHTSVDEEHDWKSYYGCDGKDWEKCHRDKFSLNLTVNSERLREALSVTKRGSGRRLVVARTWGGGLGHQWAELSPALIAAQHIGAEFVYDPFHGPGKDFESYLGLGRDMKLMKEVLGDPSLRHVQLAWQMHVVPEGYEPIDLGLRRLVDALQYYESVLDRDEDVVYVLARGQNSYSHCESLAWLRDKYWSTRKLHPAKCFLRDGACAERDFKDPSVELGRDRLNIVAHVRRGNAVGIDWRLLKCEYFRDLLDRVLKVLPEGLFRYVDIHMMCEDSIEWFACMRSHPVLGQSTAFLGKSRNESAMPFPRVDMFLHLHTPLLEDFHTLVAGDVFITSKSGFSEVGAMISRGLKLVVPFWHALDCDESYIPVEQESRSFDEALLTRKVAELR